MNDYKNKPPFPFEENLKLNTEIRSILEENVSDKQKVKKLQQLQETAQSDLGKGHAAYLLEQFRLRKSVRYKHCISTVILLAILGFILYRSYLLIHPEKYTIVSLLGLPPVDYAIILLLLPFLFFAYYLIVYLVSSKK